jgi:hypothetical protein
VLLEKVLCGDHIEVPADDVRNDNDNDNNNNNDGDCDDVQHRRHREAAHIPVAPLRQSLDVLPPTRDYVQTGRMQ